MCYLQNAQVPWFAIRFWQTTYFAIFNKHTTHSKKFPTNLRKPSFPHPAITQFHVMLSARIAALCTHQVNLKIQCRMARE